MKKYVLAAVTTIILLPVLLVLALPFWFGREAEKTYHDMLDQLSGRSGILFTAKHYERGWLSSSAETTLRHPQIPLEFKARHRISHGPLPLDRFLEGDWRLTPVQARITSQISLDAPGKQNTSSWPPLSAETTLRLNGDGTLHAEMPPIETTGDKGEIIDWRGISADITFDQAWRKIRLDAHLPSLSVTASGQQGDVTLSKVTMHSDTQEGIAGYFFGEGSLSVGRLEFGKASGRVGLKGLALSVTARPADDTVNMIFRYTLNEGIVTDETFGPVQLVMEARRLDAASLVKFKKAIDVINRGNPPNPQMAILITGKTVVLLGELAKKAPELEITRLSFKTNEGEITGKAKFVLDGRNRDLTQSPVKLLTTLTGNLEISIPEPLLKRLLTPVIRQDIVAFRQRGALTADELAKLDPEAMAKIVNLAFPQYLSRNEFTRLLVEEKGLYKLNLSVRRGQMLINGNPWHAPTRFELSP